MADSRFNMQSEGHWSLSGTLDFATVPGLLPYVAALAQGRGTAELDLGDVTRADSAGLALLIECKRIAARAGRELRLVNLPVQLDSIARVSGLAQILDLSEKGSA